MNKTIVFALMMLTLASCEPFLEKDISKIAPQLLAPQNEDTVVSGSVSLWWEEVEFATGYRLQVVLPDFNQPTQLFLDTLISGTTFSVQLVENKYQWRVRAENTNSISLWAMRDLYVLNSNDLTSQIVVLKNPSANTAQRDSTVVFSWFPLITATGYDFALQDSSGSIIYQQTQSADTLKYTFTNEGFYTWKLRAFNSESQSAYFSRSLYFDKTAPNQPALTLPQFGDTITSGQILLQWNRGLESGSPIRDSIFIYNDSLITLSGIYFSNTASYQLTTPPGEFFWRVRSVDNAGNSSSYSTTFKYIAE